MADQTGTVPGVTIATWRRRGLRFVVITLIATATAGVVLLLGGPSTPAVSAIPAMPVPAARHLDTIRNGPEALLARTMREVNANRLDIALAEVDKIIDAYPNFRLAHLIKGDILLARARPLTTLGNAIGAPSEEIEDLRDEARARMARHDQERPMGRVPRYLVQLTNEQRHAFVVDTSKSTLYVFENDDGKLRYRADYYVSIGKNGTDKYREGDNKTPLGVYHVTDWLSQVQLASQYGKASGLYGAGALPLDYPNAWDRREGRNGHGIWLHGVPFDTYSRPPRASNGCVALTNEDLLTLTKEVQIGLTPVVIANGVDWVAPEANMLMREEINAQLGGWKQDWESLDTEKYLRHYATDFSSGKGGLKKWSVHKRRVNASKKWIKVKLDNVSIVLYPGRDDLAVVTFDQDYSSSNYRKRMRKLQYWIRKGKAWRILHEGAA
ncbi:MAG: L,D-transpeptidase Cds6 family protein [Burkholderiales bacterium]